MSSRPPLTCTHELRPGTTVCLHCRHEAHQLREAARRQTLVRAAMGAVAIVAIAAAGVTAAKLIGSDAATTGILVPPVESAGMLSQSDASDDLLAGVRLLEAAPVPHIRRATHAPQIDSGRTDLGDGIFAVRTGDMVRVHFDTELARTRRAPKFERIVRQTLPAVYGAVADTLLARIPAGTMTAGGDLVRDLPALGIRLDAGAGAGLAVMIRPVTRPGRDGDIVVAYTVVGSR